MRILLTTDGYVPMINGVVTSVLNLRQELINRGHDVRILTLSTNEHSYTENSVYYLGSFRFPIYPDLHATMHMSSSFMNEILAWKPEIVHSQCEFFTFKFARRIASRSGAPLIHTYHTMYESYAKYVKLNERMGDMAVPRFLHSRLRNVQRIIAPTQKVADALKSYRLHAPISIVPTGIDLSKFLLKDPEETRELQRANLKIKKGSTVLVSVGRIAQEKNSEELVRNMIPLVAWNKDLVLLFVGDGPQRLYLQELVRSLSLTDNILFSGMVSPDKIASYYQMGDIFVSASESETQGLTYIEAMASALPVVCRFDTCLTNVVTEGYNGYTYDENHEYITAIKRIFEDKELAKSLSVHSLEVAKQIFQN
ncbi:glycosyltransferase [uncultured Sphaerochaeta sp.]|uniref:glycosyltransferase n=1 Tax=uncultured Sphaerochaeta sp. TaxID=886478 RepID=UPI002A0A5D55|nr:glycosyltransferase [uncultured Sphaerochaeta sp.]